MPKLVVVGPFGAILGTLLEFSEYFSTFKDSEELATSIRSRIDQHSTDVGGGEVYITRREANFLRDIISKIRGVVFEDPEFDALSKELLESGFTGKGLSRASYLFGEKVD